MTKLDKIKAEIKAAQEKNPSMRNHIHTEIPDLLLQYIVEASCND